MLARGEEAIAVYDALDARFGSDSEPAMRARVARALFDKGVQLGALGHGEVEIAVYDALDARFGGDGDPAIIELVAKGLVRRGNLTFDLGERLDAAELAYRRAVSLAPRSEAARANLAWLLIIVGRANEAWGNSGGIAIFPAREARVARRRARAREGQHRLRYGISRQGARARLATAGGILRRPATPASPRRGAWVCRTGSRPAASTSSMRRSTPPSSPMSGASASCATSIRKSAARLRISTTSSRRRGGMPAVSRLASRSEGGSEKRRTIGHVTEDSAPWLSLELNSCYRLFLIG